MEEKNTESSYNDTSTTIITMIIVVVIIAGIIFGIKSLGNFLFGDSSSEISDSESLTDDVALMSYAQTVLDDYLSSPSYSKNTKDYTFVQTGLRYKIEGKVNGEKFYLIIEFDDDTYKTYTVQSLQVGNKKY